MKANTNGIVLFIDTEMKPHMDNIEVEIDFKSEVEEVLALRANNVQIVVPFKDVQKVVDETRKEKEDGTDR